MGGWSKRPTTARDRPWGTIDAVASDQTFNGADLLWNTVMNNTAEYINQNGGSASVNHRIFKQISWENEYLLMLTK